MTTSTRAVCRQLLHVEDWGRTVHMGEIVRAATPAATASTPPLFYTVVVRWVCCCVEYAVAVHIRAHMASLFFLYRPTQGQFYHLPHPVRLLKLHCDHHTRMGFNGTLMYLHPQHLHQFADDPVGQLLTNSGHVILVRWQAVAHVRTDTNGCTRCLCACLDRHST